MLLCCVVYNCEYFWHPFLHLFRVDETEMRRLFVSQTTVFSLSYYLDED